MKPTKQPSGSYRVQKMINGKRYSITFDHKPSKKEIQEAINHLDPNRSDKTFLECADLYIQNKSNVLSPSTIRGYRKDLRMVPEWFCRYKISDIDQVLIQKCINELSGSYSPKTVRNIHGLISAILRHFNPQIIISTTLPKKAKIEPYIPSSDDIRRILEYLKDDSIYVPVLLGCYGLRKSEMMALDLEDVKEDRIVINKAMVRDDQNNWIVKPMTKTESSCRVVFIPPEISELIHKQGFVYNGSENALNRHLHVAQDNLCIPRFSYHKLRHYFASIMSTLTDEQTVLDAGGWSSDYVMKSVYRHSLEIEEKRRKIALDLHSAIS